MTIIDITHPKQIRSAWYGYMNISAEKALEDCFKMHAVQSEVVYRKVLPSGREVFYIPVYEEASNG